uniref:cellulose 1,4-beta-cellobiosidase (non-reducing end) n=1 Tax=uncultured symbiotic protist of Neotermes koshunensis TaxID=403660 RepID=A4UWY8_9EUKA|nr:putative glycosyl hydrolase family7 [uncultured symbiotic protist of Neotermes koshunensis]
MLGLLVGIALSKGGPPLIWQECTKASCTPHLGSVVSDWKNGVQDSIDFDALDYEKDIGVTTSGGSLSQRLVSKSTGKKVIGSRLYLMDSTGTKYQLFTFIGKEFTYDVDVSTLPCGVNAALYAVEMAADGSKGSGSNRAKSGAAYGTGYCDGNYVDGTGCGEFDIQEANNKAMVYTIHPCNGVGQGVQGCDTSGCGYNVYRDSGNKAFWGTTINTAEKITVVTQFVGSGSTLREIRRRYVQGGKTIDVPDRTKYLNAAFCGASKISAIARSFAQGYVIVFSLWDSNGMAWLDGGSAGPCTGNEQVEQFENANPNAHVVWSNIKYGDIDTTY